MKFRKLLIVTVIILFISGCSDFIMICSLNPFYLEKDVTLAPEIEGNWSVHPIQSKKDSTEKNSSHWEMSDTTSVWQIRQFISEEKLKNKQGTDSVVFKPQNFYVVKLTGNNPDSAQYQFRLVLFRVKDFLYADFSPRETAAIQNSRMAKENYFTVHTLARITVRNKQLIVSWLGNEYMKSMIEEKRVRIKYRWVEDAKRLLLTASSKELTDMIERYADQKRFIDWDDQLAMLKLNRINE
ncbi:MAG TPA: hypothetical protein DCR40_20670 [Prolixibacteraceae bacterium]|nr:hypothetical protein [Prolixibacteraceae bacterium]